MARPLRIEYEGALYHVTSRGNERKAIFRGGPDRAKFLELIRRAVEQFDLRLHAYVLMDNHYHLLIETRRAGLNRALRYLNGCTPRRLTGAINGLVTYFRADTKRSW